MAKITRDSLLSLEAYHKDRPEIREKAIQERRIRTVHLGEHLTMIFGGGNEAFTSPHPHCCSSDQHFDFDAKPLGSSDEALHC